MASPRKLPVWIAEHPLIASIVLAVLVGCCLIRVHHLEIDSSTRGLMDEKDPKKEVYEAFKDTFGSDILTAVVIAAPDGESVFRTETLELVERLTDAIYELEGVTSVTSLTTVNKIRDEDGYLNTDPLVYGVPEDPDELASIRINALETPVFPGNIVSEDGTHAAINIYTESDDAAQFDARFLAELEALIKAETGDHEIYAVGGPRFSVQFNRSIERDQVTLVPASVTVILIILLLVFRAPLAVVLPIVTGALSIAATVGFMAWMGYSVSAISVMVPSILIVVGCTEDVHLISEYYAHLRSGLSPKAACVETMRHGSLAISLTSLTTMLGFGTLALNDITALKEFGIIASFGLFANFVITLVTVPAVLRWSKRAPSKGGGLLEPLIHRFLDFAVRVNTDSRHITRWVTLGIIVTAVWGCLQLQVNNDPISFFHEESRIRRDFDRIHRDLAGAQAFNIVIETAEPGDVKEPDVLEGVADLQRFLDEMGLFDKTISLADFVMTMNREIQADPDAFTVPENRETIAEYLLLLQNDDLFRYVDNEEQRLSIAVRHDLSGSAEVKAATARIETWLAEHLTNYVVDGQIREIDSAITGESILLHSATDAMIEGQVKSLGLALLAILIIISSLFLSIKAGFVALLSNSIPILLNFGLMGWLGIPFNTGTCLIATIALGIAVDDTIHFMVRYQKELRACNDQKAAMVAAIRAEGEPIAITSTALALGFAVMALSQFSPSQHLGFLSALVMLYALMTDLFVNPVMLMMIQLITLWDYVGLKLKETAMRGSLIFANLSLSEIKKVILLGSLWKVKRDTLFVKEGDHGAEMYVILSGFVRVFLERNRDKTITVLEEGDILGEMALLHGGTRTASAEALYDLELLRIDQHALDRVERREPRIAAKLYANISRVLSLRVQETTESAVPLTDRARMVDEERSGQDPS